MSLRSFVIAFLCLALSWAGSVNSATAQPAEKPAKAERMVRVTYPVGDLVERPANLEQKTRAQLLIWAITEKVAPKSWEQANGRGNVHYFPFGEALVVYQSVEVQEQIAAFLANLRAAEPKKQPDTKRQAIERRLRQPISFHFKEVALPKAVEDLAQLSGVPIVLDMKALKDARIDLKATVTFKAQEMDMKSSLKLLLDDLELAFVIQDNALMITTPSKGSRLVRKTYDVADLIKNMALVDGNAKMGPLKDLIQETVAKESWENSGGCGKIQYLSVEKKLVIEQTQEAFEEVELLLATLRKLYDLSVCIESRAVIISAKTAKQIRKNLAQEGKSVDVIDAKKSTPLFSIDDKQLRKLLEFVQTDRAAHVMQAPKITLLNGQNAKAGGMLEGLGGTIFDYQPVVSPDRRSVRLTMTYEYRTIADSVERIIRATKRFNLPDGRTLVWDLGASSDGQHLFVLVTARILMQEEKERVFLGELPPIPR